MGRSEKPVTELVFKDSLLLSMLAILNKMIIIKRHQMQQGMKNRDKWPDLL